MLKTTSPPKKKNSERNQRRLNEMERQIILMMGRYSTVTMSMLPKLIYRLNTTTIRIVTNMLSDIDKAILKVT